MNTRIVATITSFAMATSLLVGCGAPQSTEEKKEVEVVTKADKLGDYQPLASFTAKTSAGKDFSKSDFENKDATFVLVWSAKDEGASSLLADLQSWSTLLPDMVQVVTFCKDYDESAAQILEGSGFKGTTVVEGDGDYQALLDEVLSTPLALVIDAEGNVIGETLEGVPDNVTNAYSKLLNQALVSEGREKINIAAL